MSKLGYKRFAYIDDFVSILPSSVADEAFQAFSELIQKIGLSIIPCKALCLSIHTDLNIKTSSIDSDEVKVIYDECHRTKFKKHLFKKAFLSLLAKLIYVHKCVYSCSDRCKQDAFLI